MSKFDYDLVVIGAGSGGVRASRIAAQLGAKVAIIESRYLGGTCVNVGCVPKKLFVYGSHFADEFADSRGFGWDFDNLRFDWRRLRDNKNSEIARLNDIYRELLQDTGVEIVNGHGYIASPNLVRVRDSELSAANIIVATGGWPFVPSFPGSDFAITSNEVFYLQELPASIAIVGGGYIAVEFAGIFHGLGVETHLIYRGPMFLRHFDDDIRRHTAEELKKKGIHLHFSCDVNAIEKATASNRYQLRLSTGGDLEVNQVMYATGRRPMTDNLGLENTKVRCNERGEIEIDKNFRTTEPSIYAIGDVKGGIELTPVAIAEGMVLANNLFGTQRSLDYNTIPTAVFCQPNIATVGLTEQQAREKYRSISIYESDFSPLKHTLSGSPERTFMKLVVDDDSNKVVGCHMVGAEAGEIIQGLAVAIKAGATKNDFDQTIGIHPTAAEEFVTMRIPRR